MIRIGDFVRIKTKVNTLAFKTGDIGRVYNYCNREFLRRKWYYVKILRTNQSTLWKPNEIKKLKKDDAFIEVL